MKLSEFGRKKNADLRRRIFTIFLAKIQNKYTNHLTNVIECYGVQSLSDAKYY